MPARFPVGTIARTMSPVWKPLTRLAPFGLEQGKPSLFTLHICLLPCPLAAMSSGTIPLTSSCSGVLLPTQAASIQWALGKLRMVRLYFVNPPLPHSTDNPQAPRRSNKAHRVLLTAAASERGALACA